MLLRGNWFQNPKLDCGPLQRNLPAVDALETTESVAPDIVVCSVIGFLCSDLSDQCLNGLSTEAKISPREKFAGGGACGFVGLASVVSIQG